MHPRSTFHVDTSYVRTPPAFTALRAVAVPEHGGHTLFTNQYLAYDTLPAGVRDDLYGCTIRSALSKFLLLSYIVICWCDLAVR